MIITTNFICKPFDAMTIWPFIFVRSERKDDKALLAHEMVHYRAMAWITPFWFLRYAFSKSFRWAEEVKAYRVQVGLGGIAAPEAETLLMQYDTGRTFGEALAAVQA